ncbi:ATP-binding response regulator [Chitinophaga deserti]|uniref:ATP-binding response regulator n=1 Tax=Chitinophaga deserti TaxID=2164099 RepID=UPI000D6B4597|nr:hybrid sensor histidine kinase/response regulator [Chitinophaga deserti]
MSVQTMVRSAGKLIKTIIKTGTRGLHDEAAIQSVVLVNSLSVALSLLVLLIGPFFYLLTGNPYIVYPALAECIIAALPLYLNYTNRHTTAALVTFLNQCSAVLYFGLALGDVLLLQLMVVFLIAVTFLIFKKPRIRRFCLLTAVAVLITLEAGHYFHIGQFIYLDPQTAAIFRWCSMAGMLTLIVLTGKHYVRSSDFRRIFLYQITHELRTPLNAVMLAGQLIKRELTFKPDARRIAALTDHLLAAGNSADNILGNVLQLARSESGRHDASQACSIEVFPFFSQIVQLHAVIAQYSSMSLRLSVENMPPFISADPAKLHVITGNLLAHAIQFADRNSEVGVLVRRAGDRWEIRVSNAGPGITDEQLEHVFEPFVTQGNLQVEGTGLGLFITRAKTLSMGGRINVENQPGERTTFIVSLPLITTAPGTTPSLLPDSGTADEALNLHVLIADDNDMNNLLLAKFLRRMGCRVSMAVNGLEALRQAAHATPDVIILDYHMPVMDGKEVLEKVREEASLKHIPVIMATADAYHSTRQLLMDAGATAFLQKPISFGMLQQTLQACLK